MIGIVGGRSAGGHSVPLDGLGEAAPRAGRAGQLSGDFLGYWVHRLIFYRAEPWVFTVGYVVFGLAVVAACC